METNLQKAILELNSPVNPFEFAIEGDEVIGTWKWMDATFFKPGGISKEVQDYEFHVKIDSSRHKCLGKNGSSCFFLSKTSLFLTVSCVSHRMDI